MDWGGGAFKGTCKQFRQRFSDFENFEDPGVKYQSEERKWKAEFVGL